MKCPQCKGKVEEVVLLQAHRARVRPCGCVTGSTDNSEGYSALLRHKKHLSRSKAKRKGAGRRQRGR